jgi:hypothetical protein
MPMKTRAFVQVVSLLLAAGCSKPSAYWYQPAKSFEQARNDYCACRDRARREASEAVADEYLDDAFSPVGAPRVYSTPHDDASLSHNPFDAWSTWGQMYEGNVFTGCMERRGYRRVKADRLPARVRTQRLSMAAIAGH